MSRSIASTLKWFIAVVAVNGAVGWWQSAVAQQQTTVTAPMHGINDGFFEGTNVGFSAAGRNGFFNGIGGGQPPFGNFAPGAGANLGFGVGFPGGNAFFNLGAGQGSSSSLSSAAASVTAMDGATGSFANVTQVPFVIGLVPVVGGPGGAAGGLNGVAGQFGPAGLAVNAASTTALDERIARLREGGGLNLGQTRGAAPIAAAKMAPPDRHEAAAADDPVVRKLAQAKRSSAGHPAMSIADLQEQQRAEDETAASEVQSLLDQGRAAQVAGKTAVARIYYQQAAGRASGELKHQAQEAIRSLGESSSKR